MTGFTATLIRTGLYSIDQPYVRCFLAIGEQQALLIDTGIGGDDLKAFVETITQLPVTVVFTHADTDHVGHAAQFARHFMHPCEFDYYRQGRLKYGEQPVSMTPLWEGEAIDIGTFRFEAILIPDHTPGSIALLERRQRFLIAGDSVQTGTIFMFGNGRNFDAYRASMRKLQTSLPVFDIVYASHGALTVEPAVIAVLEAAADRVMAGAVPGKPNGRGFDDTVRRYEINGVAFFAAMPQPV